MNIQTNNYSNFNPKFNGLTSAKKYVFNPDTIVRMADILQLSRGEISAQTQQMNPKQFDFFYTLIDKYNQLYHYAEKKESPEQIFKLTELVPSPKRIHHKIINTVSSSFENLAKIFEHAKTKKDLKFVTNFGKEIFGKKTFSENLLPDILESPNKKEYLKHIDDYKSYLRLNRKNENAIKDLDKMLLEGRYDRTVYDKQYGLKAFKNSLETKHVIDVEDLEAYYSPEGESFIRNFMHLYRIPENFSNAAKKDIAQIYKTCTDKNIDIREFILAKFQSKLYYSNNFEDEIKALRSVYEKIDSDKQAYKLASNLANRAEDIGSLSALQEVLDAVPAQKGNIFKRNLQRIIKITSPGEERVKALQNELENPFFETDISKNFKRIKESSIKSGYDSKKGIFAKMYIKLENAFNKLRYSLVSKKDMAVKPETAKPEAAKPEQEIAAIPQITKQPELVELPKFEQEISKETLETPAVKLVNTVLSKAQKRKIEAQESVRKFIHERLNPNIVNEQENIYKNKATKMRLKMLPEILGSIKDTRAADRAKGIKHPKISNYDAVDLYTRIDGKNRKLVNYMLKKRNIDGTRMFNVNDIINEIGKVHKRVILERLKPMQAKELYEETYQAKLNEFGKLK